MPLAQPLGFILVFVLFVVVGILTSPLWMKAARNFGKLLKNQLDESTKEIKSETNDKEGENQ
jgi:hypothetical protein